MKQEKPYECDTCQRRFWTEGGKESHEIRHGRNQNNRFDYITKTLA